MNKVTLFAVLLISAYSVFSAGPEVSFSGYLDADVWADLRGSYFTNSELDLGMSLKLNEFVSAHVYATMLSAYSLSGQGQVPAGTGLPSERWVTVNFDGFDITFDSRFGTFSAGDLVFQYGKFNYYFYKRLSMITPESFTRGVRYGTSSDRFSQEISAGIADVGDHSADLNGTTGLKFNENNSLGLFYGFRGSASENFTNGTDFFAGAKYLGNAGALSIKADIGYNNLSGDVRKNVLTFLLEPSIALNKFTAAFTGYVMYDPDSANDISESPLFKLSDELLFYVEPGYSFNDLFAAGLPLEYHGADLEDRDDNSFWIVPTFYIYPAEKVQWWLWGQVVIPQAEEIGSEDLMYGIGSEIIVEF
ncbi:MAG: hypothetical protein GX556_08620 [Fibrobacter sp.]|nr:hypothetical protein [Fibrobacter sp.]